MVLGKRSNASEDAEGYTVMTRLRFLPLLVLPLLLAWHTRKVSRSPALPLVYILKSCSSSSWGLCFTLWGCTDTELWAAQKVCLCVYPLMCLFRISQHLFQQLWSVWGDILRVRWFKSGFMSMFHLLYRLCSKCMNLCHSKKLGGGKQWVGGKPFLAMSPVNTEVRLAFHGSQWSWSRWIHETLNRWVSILFYRVT